MGLKSVKYIELDDLKGVLYAAGRQSLLVPVDIVKTLHSVFVRLLGKEGAELLIYKIGEGLGRGFVCSLESILKKEKVKFSKKTKIKIVCNAIFMESGWGRIRVNEMDLNKNTAKVEISNMPSGKFSETYDLSLERGILAGVYERITKKKVYYRIIKREKSKHKIVLSMDDELPIEFLEKGQMALLSRKQLEQKIKKATKEIIEEKEKIALILDSLVDGLIMLDSAGRVMMVNPQAEKNLKIKQKNVVGKKIAEIGVHKCFADLFKEIKSTGKEKFLAKDLSLFDTAKEEEYFFNISAKTVRIDEDDKEGTMFVIHDVTRSKMIDRLKAEFITIAAHQLRTPLSSVKWILKMTLDGDFGPLSLEQKNFLEKGYLANERMARLVNDLLDISRVEEGKFGFDFLENDVIGFVEETVDSFRVEAARRKVKLIFEEKKEPLLLKIDIRRLRMALSNLIDNAIRYTSSGGRVIVSVKKKGRFVEVSVADTGVGIPKKQQGRVFSKFFRADNVVKMQTEGSGLGLYLTKNIIKGHGGKIWFESDAGRGSKFYFTLPKN
ncbi:PAS domain-containing protein [Patescibacteria group bacterium]|nr:PAS domain-containing protein [Patescibacteria group bacterium]